MNLQTSYLGLDLPHPFIVGASPLGSTVDRVRAAEDAGAAALVFHSLFEEQIEHHESGLHAHVEAYAESFAEASGYFSSAVDYHYGPEEYLEHLAQCRKAVDMPLIASLNGTTPGGWTHYARQIAETGVDALELNLYYQPRTDEEYGALIEANFIEVVGKIREAVSLPLAVKLSPFFTSLPHFVRRLELDGAAGVVLFNRFYQPDIDLESLQLKPSLHLSDSSELLLRLRWLAMLHGRYELSIACTGGIHTRDDALKAVMAGADALQLVSCLLQKGLGQIEELRREVAFWLEEQEYESLSQARGSMSYLHAPNPEALERANYLRILQSWEA